MPLRTAIARFARHVPRTSPQRPVLHPYRPLIRCPYHATGFNARRLDNLPRDTAPSAPSGTAKSGDGNAAETDKLSMLDVLSSAPAPASAIDTLFDDGFRFESGLQFRDGSGVVLVANEAFKWRPVERGTEAEKTAVSRGVIELGADMWGILDVMDRKPELLIIGTGKKTLLLAPKDRERLMDLGIRMDVMSTHNAAAQYNMLATERPGDVGAAMLVDSFGS